MRSAIGAVILACSIRCRPSRSLLKGALACLGGKCVLPGFQDIDAFVERRYPLHVIS